MIYTDIPSWVRINNGVPASDMQLSAKQKTVFTTVISYLVTDETGLTFVFSDINTASEEMDVPLYALQKAASTMSEYVYKTRGPGGNILEYKIKTRGDDCMAVVKNGIAQLVQGGLFA